MEAINVGILSIIPPIIAIVLALTSKDVISSLIIGIFSGTLIYVFNSPLQAQGDISIFYSVILAFEYMFNIMVSKFDVMMIIFMSILGALVAVITLAGGARAYGEWAFKKVKSKRGAKLSTAFLSLSMFIDDYFNCLTVGTVMKPVTDRFSISREKLAYMIDSMAAPICIIAPISSWAASVIAYFPDNGDRIGLFLDIIPFNLYALLTIIMVFAISIWSLDFGPMAKAERAARNQEKSQNSMHISDELANAKISQKGKIMDLVLPILALIIFCVFAMLYTGGYFAEDKSLFQGFGDTSPTKSLVLGGFGALIVAYILFTSRKVLKFSEFTSGITMGVKSMVGACMILALAWTVKGVCDVLSTGIYVSHLVQSSSMPIMLIPGIVFAVAAILSFSIGTSWGTFGILIPIMISISENLAPELMAINLAATLAGAVFGDHCSPISDTTILSSTGAGCNHISHVTTQIPYAILVAFVSFIGFIIAGATQNWLASFGVSVILLIGLLYTLHRRDLRLNLNK